VCDDFSACVFCFCDFLVCFVRIRSFATPSRRSPRLEEEDAETRGQNDDALARRLELADARADERGDTAFGRVLTERSLGQRCGRQAPGSTLVLAAREGSQLLSAREGSHLLRLVDC